MTFGQGQEITLTLNTHSTSLTQIHVSYPYLPTFRSQATKLLERIKVFTVTKFDLDVKKIYTNYDWPESLMLHTYKIC